MELRGDVIVVWSERISWSGLCRGGPALVAVGIVERVNVKEIGKYAVYDDVSSSKLGLCLRGALLFHHSCSVLAIHDWIF